MLCEVTWGQDQFKGNFAFKVYIKIVQQFSYQLFFLKVIAKAIRQTRIQKKKKDIVTLNAVLLYNLVT